jgi:hypothetical protein
LTAHSKAFALSAVGVLGLLYVASRLMFRAKPAA